MIERAVPETWAIITGIVRDARFLSDRLRMLAKLKLSGVLCQVVFSTWRGALRNFPEITQLISEFGFRLVEMDEPRIICRGHFVHQMIALETALAACPADAFVLRTRTDKCGEECGVFDQDVEELLSSQRYVHRADDEVGILEYRIGVMGNHIDGSRNGPVLFFWNDRIFLGHNRDLRQLLSWTVLDFDWEKVIPEQAFFARPFQDFWPALKMFFRAVNQQEAINKILWARLPDAVNDELASYLVTNALFRSAVIAEWDIMSRYFFSMPSGEPFAFNRHYRGIDLVAAGGERLPLRDRLSEVRNLDSEGAQLSHHLLREFGVSKVVAQAGATTDSLRRVSDLTISIV